MGLGARVGIRSRAMEEVCKRGMICRTQYWRFISHSWLIRNSKCLLVPLFLISYWSLNKGLGYIVVSKKREGEGQSLHTSNF